MALVFGVGVVGGGLQYLQYRQIAIANKDISPAQRLCALAGACTIWLASAVALPRVSFITWPTEPARLSRFAPEQNLLPGWIASQALFHPAASASLIMIVEAALCVCRPKPLLTFLETLWQHDQSGFSQRDREVREVFRRRQAVLRRQVRPLRRKKVVTTQLATCTGSGWLPLQGGPHSNRVLYSSVKYRP